MKSIFGITATFLLYLFSAGTASAQTTSLELKSQPGDYIGGGVDQTFGPADGIFTVLRNFDNGVSVNFNGGPHWWSLDFAGPQNTPLVPGVYENATRWPFQSATGPGLDISGEGRGCNTLTGRFEVLEAVYGTTGEVERFAATFEQHCEGGVPALLGSVLYNATGPPPPPPPTICVSEVATIPALLTEVGMLQTGMWPIFGRTWGRTLNFLQYYLLAAQWNLDNNNPRLARSLLAQFISRAVYASNLPSANPDAIPVTAADSLVCGASNVLTNIHP